MAELSASAFAPAEVGVGAGSAGASRAVIRAVIAGLSGPSVASGFTLHPVVEVGVERAVLDRLAGSCIIKSKILQ